MVYYISVQNTEKTKPRQGGFKKGIHISWQKEPFLNFIMTLIQIRSSQYLLLPNLEEMKEHAFESLDPDFPKKVKPGDFVVGGENFGCGSSREQAPGVLKALGVQAIVAKSFARIFYRNAINIGLPVIVCKELPDEVKTGDTMELSMSDGTAQANGKTYSCTKLPEYMQNILNQGGLIASLNREEE